MNSQLFSKRDRGIIKPWIRWRCKSHM